VYFKTHRSCHPKVSVQLSALSNQLNPVKQEVMDEANAWESSAEAAISLFLLKADG
jgi:hypothetical protein